MSYENISPEEWELAKIEVGRQKVIKLSIEDREMEIAINAIKKGIASELISEITGLSIERIIELREANA